MEKRWTILYKYISAEHAAEIINSQRLRMGDGTNFNDPFELMVVNSTEHTVQHITGLRILCLTNSRNMKLMWSHYADSHKGLCLAVKVPADLVYPVCYTGQRLFTTSNIDTLMKNCKNNAKKNLRKSYDGLSYIHKAALIKDKKWAYEKEYRIVQSETQKELLDDKGFYSYPIKIERVYLGCRFDGNTQDNINAIIQACRVNKIELKCMSLSQKNYSLDVRDVDDKYIDALINKLAVSL